MPSAAPPDSPGDTRQRLLQAALKAFGQHDYEAVSTRQIVEAAGANIAAISYHFGGKRALYLATAEYLADAMYQGLREELERMQAGRRGGPMGGPRGGMRAPEMMQRMQEMRQQHMARMQAGRQGPPMRGAVARQQGDAMPAPVDAPAPTAAEGQMPAGPCGQMYPGRGKQGMHRKGMRKEMMAMKRQHMQTMEQRLANIEALMREMVELQKAR